MTVALRPASRADRDDAAAFAGRVARWDPMGPVRLRAGAGGVVRMWATTPFDTLVTRAVASTMTPADATVHAGNLLAGLAVATGDSVDPGRVIDSAWRSQLPPATGWSVVDRVPARVVAELAADGVRQAGRTAGPTGGASAALLDSEVLSVSGAGMRVTVPMRMLFALSGMGFAPASGEAGSAEDVVAEPGLAESEPEMVRISATDSWVRIDARYGAVVRRRHTLLPLFA